MSHHPHPRNQITQKYTSCTIAQTVNAEFLIFGQEILVKPINIYMWNCQLVNLGGRERKKTLTATSVRLTDNSNHPFLSRVLAFMECIVSSSLKSATFTTPNKQGQMCGPYLQSFHLYYAYITRWLYCGNLPRTTALQWISRSKWGHAGSADQAWPH